MRERIVLDPSIHFGKPCVAGSADLMVDYAGKQAHCNVTGTSFQQGDWVSLDGTTGALYLGALPTVDARFEDQPDLQKVLGWADEIRRMAVSSCGPQSQRAEWKTSPVRHLECTRTITSTPSPMSPFTSATCVMPSTGPS